MTSDPSGSPAPPLSPRGSLPVLHPVGRPSQRRFTLLLSGALVLLILIRLLSSHPLPTPSHGSSSAAAAGYLLGLEHNNVGQVRRYLAPAQKSQARALVEGLTSRHVHLEAPGLAFASQGATRATVTIALQVCTPLHTLRQYSCEPVNHLPLGLPDQLTCVKVQGDWYVATLFEPS